MKRIIAVFVLLIFGPVPARAQFQAGGAGIGAPGGSTSQFQYNGSGNFSGTTSLTWDAANNIITNLSGFTQWLGEKRVSSQFDKTADTSLASVTGLTISLKAARTYTFRVYLHVAADAVGGHKYAIGTPDTLTATNIIYQVNSVNNTTNANIINSRQTALGGSVGVVSGTSDYTEIIGTITTSASGTLATQFAQNAASGVSSVLVGSFMIVQDMP